MTEKKLELIKDLHDLSRSYLKLDFIYIGAIAAVIAYFKMDNHAIVENFDKIKMAAIVLLILLAIDISVIGSSLYVRFDSVTENADLDRLLNRSKTSHTVQLISHALAISLIAGFLIGTYQSNKDISDACKKIVIMQDRIEQFIKINNKSPENLSEITDEDFQETIKSYSNRGVKYEKKGQKGYSLSVYLRDSDDDKEMIEVTDTFLMKDFLKQIEQF